MSSGSRSGGFSGAVSSASSAASGTTASAWYRNADFPGGSTARTHGLPYRSVYPRTASAGSAVHRAPSTATPGEAAGWTWNTTGVSAAATYLNSHPISSRRVPMSSMISTLCFPGVTGPRQEPRAVGS